MPIFNKESEDHRAHPELGEILFAVLLQYTHCFGWCLSVAEQVGLYSNRLETHEDMFIHDEAHLLSLTVTEFSTSL